MSATVHPALPLRASVIANLVARREGPLADSRKLDAARMGDVMEIVDLHRTASGTTRAKASDGAWVTATTRDGKQLLHTHADLDQLLNAGGKTRLPERKPERKPEPDSEPERKPEPDSEPEPEPEPELEPEPEPETKLVGSLDAAALLKKIATDQEQMRLNAEKIAATQERVRAAQEQAQEFFGKWDSVKERFQNALDDFAERAAGGAAKGTPAADRLLGSQYKPPVRKKPAAPPADKRTSVTEILRDTPFFEHDHELFMHGRAYTGPIHKAKTTWKSSDKPRNDHYAPNWLTASEFEDAPEVTQYKVRELAALLRLSRKTVLYTGAGISASAVGQSARSGLNKQGWLGTPSMAQPTYTHQALAALCEQGLVHEWVQQNHDGLPQKAGCPQDKINEIHGSWFDPSNPVVKFSGALDPKLYARMTEAADTADLVIVLGTSLGGLAADSTATRPALRTLTEDEDPPLGSVMINLQQTPSDGMMSLRMFGTSDSLLKKLLAEMGLPTRFKTPVRFLSCERRVLVPYDKDGQPIAEGQPRMWWDLRDRAQIRVCPENNIQRSNQTAFMHIGGKDRVNKHGRKVKAGPGNGVVLKCEARACCIELDIEAATMKLGLWWLDAAQRGAVQRLPIVNQQPEFE